LRMVLGAANAKDLLVLGQLIEAGKVTPVVDRTYALSEVPHALRYLNEGHARGKIVISMRDSNDSAHGRSVQRESIANTV
ncbi:MAG TPA: zinc-binding dehydrogenase, partial [Chloroflexota bacterium]|nr:zinc-binding dehydrogenase [Chloroflexota bacterium]